MWQEGFSAGKATILPNNKLERNTMEFKSLKNIETSFRQIRLFTLIVVCLCAALAGYSVWSTYSFAEAQRQKIYVLDGGKSLMLALSQDLSQNRPAEAKEHVRRSTNCSLPFRPIRVPSRGISPVRCSWRTRVPTTTIGISPRKGTTTVSLREISIRSCRWTAYSVTSTAIPMRYGRMPGR